MTPSSDNNKPFLSEITLRNILSFGPDTPPLPLERLNVLIGPNGVGKSNLIEAIALLRSTPNDLHKAIMNGGSPEDWIWKGMPSAEASVRVRVDHSDRLLKYPLMHCISFFAFKQRLQIYNEFIHELIDGDANLLAENHPMHKPIIYRNGVKHELPEIFSYDVSFLSQLRDPLIHAEITFLTEYYNDIRIYSEWTFGRDAVFRIPQRADMRNDRLEDDLSNLGLYLNQLRQSPKAKKRIIKALRDIYEGIDDFDVSIAAGTVQIFFTEGDFTIPATRLSDGTLRYLSLLAILCDPEPPPLICIEEPELGLHPDIIPKVADLLIEASERTQLIVTTHSDILVDALTEQPETVVVCEKHQGHTVLKRLDKAQLHSWLEKYRLGELWTRGEIGGTRW